MRTKWKFSNGIVIKTDMGWRQRIQSALVKQSHIHTFPQEENLSLLNMYQFKYWLLHAGDSFKQFSSHVGININVFVEHSVFKQINPLGSSFLSSTSVGTIQTASSDIYFRQSFIHTCYVRKIIIYIFFLVVFALDTSGQRKISSRNNDKLCAVKQNWLNWSGFCGLSVRSHKQLVIAINIYFMWTTEPGSKRCPIVEQKKIIKFLIKISFATYISHRFYVRLFYSAWKIYDGFSQKPELNVFKQYVH